MRCLAHSYKDASGGEHEQSVEEHCRQCAQFAFSAAPGGLEQTCMLAGLLHDMGKYTMAFQVYLSEGGKRGSVNHTFAGVRFVMERWHGDPGQTLRNMTAEILAFAIGSHHGQFDCLSLEGEDGYLHRVQKEGIGYEEAMGNFLACCAPLEELDGLFARAVQEITAAQKCLFPCSKDADEMLFYFALLSRMVLSAVIEGDRKDTAQFMQGRFMEEATPDWAALLSRVEAELLKFPDKEKIDLARRRIADFCRDAAFADGGIFRLNAPTGGGKTLASLRYALARALWKQKKRVFFVVPLLTVLEQNALVIRKVIQKDSLILEHHSNVVQEPQAQGERLCLSELLLENWRSPVVITTLVQLLNTLFDGKTSCVRRMGALCDSVIVIDEVQSVPGRMLTQFNLALNFLANFCGATVVLCSATQPCLDQAAHGVRYAPQPELVPYEEALWEDFRRTKIEDLRRPKGYTDEELAAFALACRRENKSVLLICNTKTEVRGIFEALRARSLGRLFHLSKAMCAEHRLQTLNAINQALDHQEPVVCVASQLVEAGVDFSFGCVIRVCAGLDNIVQAAGRCNRHGEYGCLCPVYIVNIRGENLSRLPEIRQAQQAAEATLLRFQENPGCFGEDLGSQAAIQSYYRDLYAEMPQGSQDDPLPAWNTSIFRLLSRNPESRGHCPTGNRYLLGQAFRTAGEQFRVFEDGTVDVIAPYGEGKKLIEDLNGGHVAWDLAKKKAFVKEAARFSISLFEYERRKLQAAEGIYPLCDGEFLILWPEFYSEETGLFLEGTRCADAEFI